MESKQSQVLNLERVLVLETWLKTTNTKLTQVNGQRKYGGPPEVWGGPPPEARCEVFISQIPRDTYEDLLIPLFSSVGPLWEFRLMMNFSGQNRGFAYGKYGSPAAANEAIRLLHGHMLEPGSRLSVRRSTEKRHLCIGDLPASTRQQDLLKVLRVLAEGVETLSLKAGPGIEGVSAIVAFSSHHAASMAKKMLVEAFKKQFALNTSIKWQTTVKPSLDAQLSPHKPSKSLLPPRHIPSSPLTSAPPPPLTSAPPPPLTSAPPPPLTSAPPLRMVRPPSVPLGFCRSVGGPTVSQHPPRSSPSSSQGHLVSTALLHQLCEANGGGQPRYQMYCSHAVPDGFLYFIYKVCIPGITTAFKGLVVVLPGPTATATLEEARRAAAQQVLQRLCNGVAH